jgi:hypothetical protein
VIPRGTTPRRLAMILGAIVYVDAFLPNVPGAKYARVLHDQMEPAQVFAAFHVESRRRLPATIGAFSPSCEVGLSGESYLQYFHCQ